MMNSKGLEERSQRPQTHQQLLLCCGCWSVCCCWSICCCRSAELHLSVTVCTQLKPWKINIHVECVHSLAECQGVWGMRSYLGRVSEFVYGTKMHNYVIKDDVNIGFGKS